MIRVALIDEHPALLVGLAAVLRNEPGIIPVGSAANAAQAQALMDRTHPDVVVLDAQLARGYGLELCRQIKSRTPAPKVLIYSASVDGWVGFAARAAGADGMASKAAPAPELFEIVRRVARGETVLPPVARRHLHEGASRVEEEDLGLLSMLIVGTPPRDIAETLRIPSAKLPGRMNRVLARLRAGVPAPAG